MVIDGNRRWLKPYHEKALEGLEKDRELGLEKGLDHPLTDRAEDRDQGMERTLEKGFEF
jgi:hypothetical protein